MPDTGEMAFKLTTVGATIGASFVARKAATMTWKIATGNEPPVNPEDPEVTWAEAVGWALVSGAVIGLARLVASRQTTVAYRKATGELPRSLQSAAS